MPEGPDLKQYLDAGVEFTQLRRSQAQKIVRDLVKNGQLAQEKTQSYVDELLERSRKRTEALVETVRAEVRGQFETLGIATKEDLERLERKLARAARASTTKKASEKEPAQSAGDAGKVTGGSATKKAAGK